jgi:hypothetical protein
VTEGGPGAPPGRAQDRWFARVRPFDWWVFANLVLLAAMCWLVYRKAEWEFGLYATVFIVLFAGLWRYLRRFDYPWWLYVALEIGILANFAGGLVHFGPDMVRLYGHRFFGIRFDKWVHFYNSGVLATVCSYVLHGAGVRLGRAKGIVLVLMMCGIGALWEIVEYSAVMSLPTTGVGDYHNNMRDLIANLAGGVSVATLGRWWTGHGAAGVDG